MKVEAFKTNVDETHEARELVKLISERFSFAHVNFDLHDCDNVLRVVYQEHGELELLQQFMSGRGYLVVPLPDTPSRVRDIVE